MVLPFLVSSKARRRLLTLLWAQREAGTATQLGERARISFASAYKELRRMDRWGLVTTARTPDGVVYAARRDHPDAELLDRLVRTTPPRAVDGPSRELRAHLAASGAPLRSDAPATPSPAFDDLVVEGIELARRDPDVARTMPVLLFKNREAALALANDAKAQPVAHRLGFFLALTGRLGHDAQMTRAARALRDRRVRRQDLFENAALAGGSRKNFPLARAWGLHAGADLAWFQGLFDKFVDGERP